VNYELLFWVDGCTNLCAAFLLSRFLHPGKAINKETHEAHMQPAVSAYRDKFYLWFIVLTTLFAMCFFQVFTNLTIYFRQELHFNERFIGMLMALNGLIIAFIEMILIYRLEGRRHALFYISIGVTLCAFSFMLYNVLPGTAMLAIVAITVVTIGEILSMPFMNAFWISRSNASNRGQYAGVYTIAWAMAQVLGPTLGSQVAEHYSFNALLWILAGVCLTAGVGFSLLRKMQKT
jgi:predicted MFS family arabinose efflux permease